MNTGFLTSLREESASRNKAEHKPRLWSAMGIFVLTSRTSRALYPKTVTSHTFHSLSPSPRIIPPGRCHLSSSWSSGADWAALTGKLLHFVSRALTVERVLPHAVVCHTVVFSRLPYLKWTWPTRLSAAVWLIIAAVRTTESVLGAWH